MGYRPWGHKELNTKHITSCRYKIKEIERYFSLVMRTVKMYSFNFDINSNVNYIYHAFTLYPAIRTEIFYLLIAFI